MKIYSNCDSVELTVNGKSLGSKSPDAIHVFIWPDVQLTDGDNQVKAVGSKAGKTFTDECTIHCDNNAATQPGK